MKSFLSFYFYWYSSWKTVQKKKIFSIYTFFNFKLLQFSLQFKKKKLKKKKKSRVSLSPIQTRCYSKWKTYTRGRGHIRKFVGCQRSNMEVCIRKHILRCGKLLLNREADYERLTIDIYGSRSVGDLLPVYSFWLLNCHILASFAGRKWAD